MSNIRITIQAFTGRYPFASHSEMAISLKIIRGERPARPQGAQELGLTDSIWGITCRCWRQVPAHRPTVTEVVGILRESSVFSLPMEPHRDMLPSVMVYVLWARLWLI